MNDKINKTIVAVSPFKSFLSLCFGGVFRNSWGMAFLQWFGFGFLLLFAIVLGHLLGKIELLLKNPHNIVELDGYSLYSLPSEIYDINGKKISEFFMFKRKIVPFHKIPIAFVDVLTLVEDVRFYVHNGVDWWSVTRAMFKNLLAGSIVEGGSTLTQQLAKLFFTNRARTMKRKIMELWLAFQIENRYGKNEILEKYLNQVYFGDGVHGVAMAAQHFMGRSLSELKMEEIAMLVGMIAAPNRYSPYRQRKSAQARHLMILSRMEDCGYIAKGSVLKLFERFWNRMMNRTPSFGVETRVIRLDEAPYFSEHVRQIVELKLQQLLLEESEGKMSDLSRLDHDFLIQRARNWLFTGGFQIYTSLDLSMQRIAQEELNFQIERQRKVFKRNNVLEYEKLKKRYLSMINFLGLSFMDSSFLFDFKQHGKSVLKLLEDRLFLVSANSLYSYSHVFDFIKRLEERNVFWDDLPNLQGGVLFLDPETGYVKVMAGGTNFDITQVNHVFAKRQPGSAFKMFLYAVALEQGLQIDDFVEDYPVQFYNKKTKELWSPKNNTNKYFGWIDIKTAFQLSVNTVAAQLAYYVGMEDVFSFIERILNVQNNMTNEHYYLSGALGTKEMTPMDIVRGISVFSNGGYSVEPVFILKIVDRRGHVVYDYYQKDFMQNSGLKHRPVVSSGVVTSMQMLLESVFAGGWGLRLKKMEGIDFQIGGKTGTTQKNRDAWFVGMSGHYTGVVWIGFDDGLSLGNKQYGANVSTPVWFRIMHKIHAGLKKRKFKSAMGNMFVNKKQVEQKFCHPSFCKKAIVTQQKQVTKKENKTKNKTLQPNKIAEVRREKN